MFLYIFIILEIVGDDFESERFANQKYLCEFVQLKGIDVVNLEKIYLVTAGFEINTCSVRFCGTKNLARLETMTQS